MGQRVMTGGGALRGAAVVAFAVLSISAVMPASALAHQGSRPSLTKLCRHGGWRTLQTSRGRSFRNERQCVRYAAHRGNLRSRPGGDDQALWQMMCQLGGGDFSASPGLWNCSAPFPPGLTQKVYEFLSGTCSAAGGVTVPANGGPGLPDVQCQNAGAAPRR